MSPSSQGSVPDRGLGAERSPRAGVELAFDADGAVQGVLAPREREERLPLVDRERAVPGPAEADGVRQIGKFVNILRGRQSRCGCERASSSE